MDRDRTYLLPWIAGAAAVVALAVLLIVGLGSTRDRPAPSLPGPLVGDIAVPDLTKQSISDAHAFLDADKSCPRPPCYVVKEEPNYDGGFEAGIVVGQDPSPGSHVQEGSTLTLFVSQGAQTSPSVQQVTVPDVSNRLEKDAIDQLDAACEPAPCLNANVQPTAEPADADPGIVVAQDPAAGTSAEHGSTVTLYVKQ